MLRRCDKSPKSLSRWKEEIKSSGPRWETSSSWVKGLVLMKAAAYSPAVVDVTAPRQTGVRDLSAGRGTEKSDVTRR